MRSKSFAGRHLAARVSQPVMVLSILASILGTPVLAQAAITNPSKDTSNPIQTEAAVLRDVFVTRLHNAGFTCPLAIPDIVVEDVPSFGQYRPETNVIRTSNWTLLSPEEKGMFVQLAGPGKTESDAQQLLDVAHQWIFIHELGHWWQACSGGNADRSHYRVEYGANRISLAYWREVKPKVAETMKPVFQAVVDHAPLPCRQISLWSPTSTPIMRL